MVFCTVAKGKIQNVLSRASASLPTLKRCVSPPLNISRYGRLICGCETLKIPTRLYTGEVERLLHFLGIIILSECRFSFPVKFLFYLLLFPVWVCVYPCMHAHILTCYSLHAKFIGKHSDLVVPSTFWCRNSIGCHCSEYSWLAGFELCGPSSSLSPISLPWEYRDYRCELLHRLSSHSEDWTQVLRLV